MLYEIPQNSILHTNKAYCITYQCTGPPTHGNLYQHSLWPVTLVNKIRNTEVPSTTYIIHLFIHATNVENGKQDISMLQPCFTLSPSTLGTSFRSPTIVEQAVGDKQSDTNITLCIPHPIKFTYTKHVHHTKRCKSIK